MWKAQHADAVTARAQGQPDAEAAFLGTLVKDLACPASVKTEALGRLADLCLNAFGDPEAAQVLLRQQARISGMTLESELAQIVADQYSGESDPTAISARLVSLARVHLSHQPVGRPTRTAGPRPRRRIALVSNQWCASPLAFLTLGVFRAMATHADLLIFDRGGKHDWAHAAFRDIAREWHDVRGRPEDTVHQAIESSDADALIDLSGWTDPIALKAVARRPAPVQLKWVGGQSSTTGANCFDGFVADARQVPGPCETLYSEPVRRASIGYITYTPPPYWRPGAAVEYPPATMAPDRGDRVYAIAANPVKISRQTAEFVRGLRPTKLLLIDHRWRYRNTRRVAAQRMGSLLDVAEFISPATHPDFLATLAATQATFVDTTPYSMGLAAVELRLLGKHIVQPPRPPLRSISECHCSGHLGARSFGHHTQLASELLAWCDAR